MLAPGEWAVRDAVLHVGRVPVFYLPFFFKPGDDFFFHPVLGYRDREGFFIQTTTYLLGQKKDKDSAFSFLRASEDSKKEYELELNGLFLKKGKKKDKKSEDARILKIIADFYTRLGGFTGAVLDLGPAWKLKGGLGFSRNIYGTAPYSPFDSTGAEKWNTTPLWGINLPFRFGFDTNFGFNLLSSAVVVSGNMQLFSDPFFEKDFYDRSEDIDWLKLIKNNDTTDTTQLNQTTTTTTTNSTYDLSYSDTQKTTISWLLNSAITFPALPPYLNTIRINSLNLGWTWYSKENADYTDGNISSVDPSRQFYYPVRWSFPDNMSLMIGGTLVNWNSQNPPPPRKPPTGEPTDIKNSNDFGKGFSFPETNQLDDSAQNAPSQNNVTAPTVGASDSAPSEKNPTEEPEEPFLEPDTLDDLTVEFGRSLASSLTIGYSLTPYLSIENQFDTENWKRPQDVNFATKYTDLTNSGSFNLTYNYSLWGALLKGSGNFLLSERYKDRLYNAPNNIWDEVSDKQNSDLYVNASTTITLQPLLDLKYFSASNFEYTLISDLYKYSYNLAIADYENHFIDWDTTFVKSHKVKATLNFTPNSITHYLAISATLPPLDGEYGGTLNFTLGGLDYYSLNTNITTSYKKTADIWAFAPLIVTETLKLSTLLALSETMTWDLNDQLFTEARTVFKTFYLPFWSKYLLEGEFILKPNEADPFNFLTSTLNIQNFAATFKAQMMEYKKLDLSEGEWVVDSDKGKAFLPQSLRFGYYYLFNNLKLWKNRITSTININTYWDLALQEFTNSQFQFTFNWSFELNEFLNFNIKITSHNYKTYLYIPAWAEQTGDMWVNPVIDLLKSFNFFYEPHRKESNFKLDEISINLTHHLHDWDLALIYTGRQELVDRDGGGQEYKWQPEFEISLEWNPIPELVHKVTQKDDVLNLRG